MVVCEIPRRDAYVGGSHKAPLKTWEKGSHFEKRAPWVWRLSKRGFRPAPKNNVFGPPPAILVKKKRGGKVPGVKANPCVKNR